MSPDKTQAQGELQLLTSPGPAAIAVIRLRGRPVEAFLQQHIQTRAKADLRGWTTGRVFRAELLDQAGCVIDDMLVSVHAPSPEWDVRLHLHGSPWLTRHCIEMLKECGLTEQAETASTLWQSEHTIEAEANALLPRMLTLRGVHWLLRQSRSLSETVRTLTETAEIEAAQRQCHEIAARRVVFDWFARPLRVALVGPPNAGKSTLANALADQHASLVSPLPGTTRDWVEIPGEINGFPVTWLDTAGLRRGGDELEAEAARRTRQLMDAADAVLLVLDASPPATPIRQEFIAEHADLHPACIALNKSDLTEVEAEVRASLPAHWRNLVVRISAARLTGFEALAARLLESAGYDTEQLAAPTAFTDRQVNALEEAAAAPYSRFQEWTLRCLGRSGSP